MLSIDPKPEAVRSCTFSGYRNGPLGEPRDRWEKAAGGCLAGTSFRGTFPDAGETFCRELTKSRKLSGATLFRVIATGRWRDFSKRIDQKPKAVWSCTFSGYRNGPLGEPRDRCGKVAGGCLAGTSFRGTFPDAGETFCRELTKSRKLSGGNIFSGYISKGWSGFSQRISPKLEAAWPERLFRAQFRRLVGFFAGYRPKAESCLELYFFGPSHWVAWGDFSKRIDQKPKAVWSCTFSGYRNGLLGEPRGWWEKAAGGCLAGTSFRGTFPDAGETFCRVSTQSWIRPGLNVFSEHNSEGWWDFSQGIDPKPKAVWRERFFGVNLRRLVGLFAGYRPKS